MLTAPFESAARVEPIDRPSLEAAVVAWVDLRDLVQELTSVLGCASQPWYARIAQRRPAYEQLLRQQAALVIPEMNLKDTDVSR
jgi:hypothetical protein